MAQSVKPLVGRRWMSSSVLAREYNKPRPPPRMRDVSWDIPEEEAMPEFVTAAEAVARIGCSHSLFGSWVTRGKLEPVAYRVNEGGKRRYRLYSSKQVIALHKRAMLDKRYHY